MNGVQLLLVAFDMATSKCKTIYLYIILTEKISEKFEC